MYNAFFAGKIDITLLVLYAFFAFFLFLVLYLLREGRREGFPLTHDVTGEPEIEPGVIFRATPKVFRMPDGTTRSKPDYVADTQEMRLQRTAAWSGSPIEPVGNPLTAGVGPGGYANRADRPDVTSHGENRIAPLRAAPDYAIDSKDPDLRGMRLYGVDDAFGGVVHDIWIDRAEFLVRYLEIALYNADGKPTGRTVLVPMTMCTVDKRAKLVRTNAVRGDQVAGAPALAKADQVTLLEEEKIVGYFGAGYLYAMSARSEPML